MQLSNKVTTLTGVSVPAMLLALAVCVYQALSAYPNSKQTPKGARVMTSAELVEALRRLDPNQEAAVDELSRNFEEEAHAPVRTAVSMLNGGDPQMGRRAASVITNIGELAIVPLLDAAPASQPASRVWNMEVVITAHLQERAKVVARLNSMLSDKVKIPWEKGKPDEGAPAPSRVCDEAYLMMRRLLNTKEDKAQFLDEREAFLQLLDGEKDKEIQKLAKSHAWTNFVEDAQ